VNRKCVFAESRIERSRLKHKRPVSSKEQSRQPRWTKGNSGRSIACHFASVIGRSSGLSGPSWRRARLLLTSASGVLEHLLPPKHNTRTIGSQQPLRPFSTGDWRLDDSRSGQIDRTNPMHVSFHSLLSSACKQTSPRLRRMVRQIAPDNEIDDLRLLTTLMGNGLTQSRDAIKPEPL
jgi:hypothetical protein